MVLKDAVGKRLICKRMCGLSDEYLRAVFAKCSTIARNRYDTEMSQALRRIAR